MIKYAANAFLATKVTFINEIANLCEYAGAMFFTWPGPWDWTGGLERSFSIPVPGMEVPVSKRHEGFIEVGARPGYSFKVLNSVIEVNEEQKRRMVDKVKAAVGD